MVAIARDAARRCALWHAVQRVAEACRASDRPFVEWPFADWSGYSFASGHTIGATLLYGQLLLFVLPLLKGAPLAIALHFRRCVDGSPGRIHPNRIGRAFSN